MNEILIVLVIGVIVIGPRQLPQVARAMGKMVAQFKRATNDLRSTLSDEVNEHVPMKDIHEMRDSLEDGVRDLQNQSHALIEDEFEDDKRIGREVADDLKSAMNDIPNADWDYGPGNGGEPRKKPSKSIATKKVRAKTKAVAANGGASAKKTASAKGSGKGGGMAKGGGIAKGNGAAKGAAAGVTTAGVTAAKSGAAKSAGKGGARSRQGGRA